MSESKVTDAHLSDGRSRSKRRGKPAGAVASLQRQAEAAASLLKALASRDRLVILCQLLHGEQTVGGISSITGIGQPTLSQQLGILRGEGLVTTRREGKHIHYRIESPAVRAVLRTLYELYCDERAPGSHSAH